MRVEQLLGTGIPYAFYRCGFFLAIILLLAVALLVNRSIMYLVSCGLKTRKLDYEALCEHVLGKPGFYVATAAMWMFAYGADFCAACGFNGLATAQLMLMLDVHVDGCHRCHGGIFDHFRRRSTQGMFSGVLQACFVLDHR